MLSDLYKYRELVWALAMKELRIRYIEQLCSRALWIDSAHVLADGTPRQMPPRYQEALVHGQVHESLVPEMRS